LSVDVIIPTYKRSKLTLEALASVLDQSYKNVNVYILEDGLHSSNNNDSELAKPSLRYDLNHISTGSTHRSGQAASVHYSLENRNQKIIQLTKKHSNIHYISLNQNYGPSFCRNLGASLGSSKYIAFLDSDDLWELSKLKKQIDYLENNSQYDYIHTNEEWRRAITLEEKIITEKSEYKIVKQKKAHRKQSGSFIERLMDRCLISPSSILFKRSFWEAQNVYFHEKFRVAEDYELWLRLNLFHPIAYLEEPLTIKRAGAWEQLSSTIEMDRQRVLALHRFYRLYKNTPEFQKIKNKWDVIITKKIDFLIKGAHKYNKKSREKEYLIWKKLFVSFVHK